MQVSFTESVRMKEVNESKGSFTSFSDLIASAFKNIASIMKQLTNVQKLHYFHVNYKYSPHWIVITLNHCILFNLLGILYINTHKSKSKTSGFITRIMTLDMKFMRYLWKYDNTFMFYFIWVYRLLTERFKFCSNESFMNYYHQEDQSITMLLYHGIL